MDKKRYLIKYSIFVLFIILPIINALRNTNIKNMNILGVSVLEIINIILILFATILTIITRKNNKKAILSLSLYTIVVVIYLIFHSINILKFNSSIYIWSDINVLKEIYYIFRLFYIPALLFFVLINNGDIFNLNFYKKKIKVLILIICGLIIALNIFKLSYATYDYNNTKFIQYNIFDYYKSNESMKMLSTKGWFVSGNEIAAVLIMLFPINIVLLIKENRKYNVFLYILQFMAMIIVGTKVSAFGAILVSLASLAINAFYSKKYRDTFSYKLLFGTVVSILYFLVSPVATYYFNNKAPHYNNNDSYSKELKKLTSKNDIAKYINDHLEVFRIDKYFVYIYPIGNDVDFWYEIALRNRNLNNDFRNLKTKMIRRVEQRNNNFHDIFWGIGYTTNFIELERDYIYQYYLFGICGIILVLPQMIVLFQSMLGIIKHMKKNRVDVSLLLIMSPLLGLIVAYFTGHVFGWMFSVYILYLLISMLYNRSLLGSD